MIFHFAIIPERSGAVSRFVRSRIHLRRTDSTESRASSLSRSVGRPPPSRARAFPIYPHRWIHKIYRRFASRFEGSTCSKGRGDALLGKSFRRMPLYPRGGPVVSLIRMIVSSDPWNGTSSTERSLLLCPPPPSPSLPRTRPFAAIL